MEFTGVCERIKRKDCVVSRDLEVEDVVLIRPLPIDINLRLKSPEVEREGKK